jgi:CheY-like chemotaxis protein
MHTLYLDVLEQKGHEVIDGAFDGVECLEKLNNSRTDPDYILMDHQLPMKDGLVAMKELLQIKPELKIIFVSEDLSIKEQVLAAGAVEFIKKPFNLPTLYDSIDKLSGSKAE